MKQSTQKRSEREPSTERLHEHIANWQTDSSRIDREQMQVLDVALTGSQSRNGYEYTEQALKQAVPLYENRPVFLDHAENASRPHERSTRDLVGSILNVRFENGRIRGDIQVLETDSGRTFLALAEKKTEFVGMSHVILARRDAEKTKVEKIEEVISVDAVVYPATTSTFQEQVSEPEDFDQKESLLESELRNVKGKLASMRSRYEKLMKKYLATIERAKNETHVEQLIEQANLPEQAMTKEFRKLLLETETDSTRKRLLQERRQLFFQLQRCSPSSSSREETETDSIDQIFVQAIKS